MEKNKAIELLKQALNEIPRLRGLRFDNQDFVLWHDRVQNIIKTTLDSDDLKRFASHRSVHIKGIFPGDVYQNDYLDRLTDYETALKSIIEKYEMFGVEEKSSATVEPQYAADFPASLFDNMHFHPRVVEASRKLFKDGHYRDAIYRAFVELNNFVKSKSGLNEDGKTLMSKVFRKENPIIKLNELKTQTDINEQEGFMFLFMGAMEGIRNPKAHENIIQEDPYKTLEYLALASLLMRRAEEGTL